MSVPAAIGGYTAIQRELFSFMTSSGWTDLSCGFYSIFLIKISGLRLKRECKSRCGIIYFTNDIRTCQLRQCNIFTTQEKIIKATRVLGDKQEEHETDSG